VESAVDELKKVLAQLAADEASVRAGRERAQVLAKELKLPPGKPFSGDGGRTLFGLTADGKLFRGTVEHV
jgi:hypothetical protein